MFVITIDKIHKKLGLKPSTERILNKYALRTWIIDILPFPKIKRKNLEIRNEKDMQQATEKSKKNDFSLTKRDEQVSFKNKKIQNTEWHKCDSNKLKQGKSQGEKLEKKSLKIYSHSRSVLDFVL